MHSDFGARLYLNFTACHCFQFGQVDGATETQTPRDHVAKRNQLHEEEVLSSAFLQPETVGLLLGGYPHRQRRSLHRQGLLLQGVQQSRRIHA